MSKTKEFMMVNDNNDNDNTDDGYTPPKVSIRERACRLFCELSMEIGEVVPIPMGDGATEYLEAFIKEVVRDRLAYLSQQEEE